VGKLWLVTAAVALIAPAPASGHQRCDGCLDRRSGSPRTAVTIAYWVVWNGRGYPQDAPLQRAHRSDRSMFDVYGDGKLPALTTAVAPDVLPVARRNVVFRVPNVPDGEYPVVIYDGSEGGEHYTWTVFSVARETDDGVAVLVALLLGTSLLVSGTLYAASRYKRRSSA